MVSLELDKEKYEGLYVDIFYKPVETTIVSISSSETVRFQNQKQKIPGFGLIAHMRQIYIKVKDINVSVEFYIITEVILAFWLILAYDLIEDRRTIDVITAIVFPLCFKMAESWIENLDKIFRAGWKIRYKKVLSRREAGRRKEKPFLFKKEYLSLSWQSSETKPNKN